MSFTQLPLRFDRSEYELLSASDLFDQNWYLRKYSDVALAGFDPVVHYLVYGAAEGRRPGPNFDGAAYLTAYQDVARSGLNPLVHFLRYGYEEGRSTAVATPTLSILLERCQESLSLVDVGARYGPDERWSRVGDKAKILCFEPDVEECARLNTTRASNVRYLPFGLADTETVLDFYVTVDPCASSLYQPLPALYENYPGLAATKLERRVRIPCRRLDDVLLQERVGDVAAIKLDTQGSELSVLKGATKALETCTLIDIEVEFNQLYANQPLFGDVDKFLRGRGFVLWRLENLTHYAPEAVAAARTDFHFSTHFDVSAPPAESVVTSVRNGQLFWAQAQYVRASYPRTRTDRLPEDAAILAAIVAGLYGFWDLSLELVRKSGDAELLETMRNSLKR